MTLPRIRRGVLLVAVTACVVVSCLVPRSAARESPQFTLSDWRAQDYGTVRFVGSDTCVTCHTTEAPQLETPMAHALSPERDLGVESPRPEMTFAAGRFTYRISREKDRLLYTVSDGKQSISAPLLYGFGKGVIGQTYVFTHEGRYYETRVSYYRALQNLDFTIGHPREAQSSLGEALGRQIPAPELQTCFACHAPTSIERNRLDLERFTPGIDCESCHGPGQDHVAAMKARKFTELHIFNPGKLLPSELSQEFCGSCHVGFEQAMLQPAQGGPNNIRFQAFRIFNSPGHGGADPRISCVACHDPHQKLEHEPGFYDSKCLACHVAGPNEPATATRKAAGCPVGKQQCTTCHMPKVDVAPMHAKFTDHLIRIVRPGDPAPR
jgi:hypothetical protein